MRMFRSLIVLSSTLVCFSIALADISAGSSALSLNLGTGIPLSSNDFDDIAKTGFAAGGSYV